MRFLPLLLLVGCAGMRPVVNFSDDSWNSEIGWVCVPQSANEWACEDIRTFAKRLQKSEKLQSDM